MPNFQYIARDTYGNRRAGFHDGESSQTVLSWLRELGLIPIQVAPAGAINKKKISVRPRKKIRSEDIAAFCWQLTTMIEGGVPVTEAIQTIIEEIENPSFQDILKQIHDRMRAGESFSDSIAQFPYVFNSIFCAMILAGESSGTLPIVLKRLAQYFDTRDKMARKVKSAIAYPLFVLGFVIFIVVMMMIFIIPRFQVIFSQIQGKLPAFTRVFMSGYELIVQNVGWILIGFAILILSSIAYAKTQRGHARMSRWVLRIPVLGKLLAHSFIAMFSRTMASLLSAGVSVLEALNILTGMTHNNVIKDAIVRSREEVLAGSDISHSMAASGFFPRMFVIMTQVGEESGSLPAVMERTSEYYEKKVDALITTLISLLEPILIITVGAIVLIVVIALYLPIFSISNPSG